MFKQISAGKTLVAQVSSPVQAQAKTYGDA
jgi:hypothetical protein